MTPDATARALTTFTARRIGAAIEPSPLETQNMPNHVFTEVILFACTADVAPLVLNEKGEVDFSVLLPLPLNFWPGNVGKDHEQHFPGTHLDAARSIWGTKWNAYGNPTIQEEDGCTVIRFQTAWDTPRGWICALFNKLNCNITSAWLDEGRADAIEEIWIAEDERQLRGPSWTKTVIPSGSADHRRLHMHLWGVEAFDEDEPEAPRAPEEMR